MNKVRDIVVSEDMAARLVLVEKKLKALYDEKNDIIGVLKQSISYLPDEIPSILINQKFNSLTYDGEANWPKKILFVLKTAEVPLTAAEIVGHMAIYEPQINRRSAMATVSTRLKTLIEYKWVLKSGEHRYYKFAITEPGLESIALIPMITSAIYPAKGSRFEKISFILNTARVPLTEETIFTVMRIYEPDLKAAFLYQLCSVIYGSCKLNKLRRINGMHTKQCYALTSYT